MPEKMNLEQALLVLLTASDEERQDAVQRLCGGRAGVSDPDGECAGPELQRHSRRGGVSSKHRDKLDARNAALQKLLEQPDFCDLPLREAATAISSAAQRYEAISWPKHRKTWGGPPTYEPHATFYDILRSGTRLPGEKQLFRILSQTFSRLV